MTTTLEAEIRQQPGVIANLLDSAAITEVAQAIREARPQYIVLAARGSSDNAARYAQYLFGIHAGLPVALATPSVHTLYGRRPRFQNTVVIGISQSGRSADVGQVVADAAAQGVLTIAITNDPESPMANTAAYHINLQAGPEQSIAATKTYTAQAATLALITAHLIDDESMLANLAFLPSFVEKALEARAIISERAERFRFMSHCVTLGRGYNYATAFEVALKLKELTYAISEPYSSADFRHGPKAMVEEAFPVIGIAPDGATFPDMLNLLKDLREQGADMTVISANPEALALADLAIPLPADIPEWLSPIVAVVPGQLLAMHIAATKGHALDNPRGLTKVTVTR
jgi:glucosamine--fructose-6-phosphate aminotransferase (isomerizing)